MSAPVAPSIAFVGWNPFQFLHFASIAERLPGSTYLIEERKTAAGVYDFNTLPGRPARVLRLDRRAMRKIDGRFDVLVCQTPFSGIEEIESTRIAMLQYGYAKEAHNFAPWRAFADVCMTFGDYASRKTETYCPCAATGNPRYERWHDESFRSTAKRKFADRIDPAKKTLIYAPTWGALSSLERFSDAVRALSEEYNIILKVHHNSQLAGSLQDVRGFRIVCDACDDIVELLAVADAMLSDFSGAIFDAIYCQIPVVLLDSPPGPDDAGSISDCYSIERVRRSEIGAVAGDPAALPRVVRQAIGNPPRTMQALQELRADLFTSPGNASASAAEILVNLANNPVPRTQAQNYLRSEMKRHYRCRAELTAARSFGGFMNMTFREVRKRLSM